MRIPCDRLVGLQLLAALALSCGLQPILAAMTLPLAAEDERSAEASLLEGSPPPAQADAESDQETGEKEEPALQTCGLCDLLDRTQRPADLSHLGDPVALLKSQLPFRRPRTQLIQESGVRRHIETDRWGRPAHWPCGPPLCEAGPLTDGTCVRFPT